jgi:hypothetical protein
MNSNDTLHIGIQCVVQIEYCTNGLAHLQLYEHLKFETYKWTRIHPVSADRKVQCKNFPPKDPD